MLLSAIVSLVAELVNGQMPMELTQVPSLIRKTPWRRTWQPTPALLPGESHGQRSLAGYSPQGHKESDMTERLTHKAVSVIHRDTRPFLSRFFSIITPPHFA